MDPGRGGKNVRKSPPGDPPADKKVRMPSKCDFIAIAPGFEPEFRKPAACLTRFFSGWRREDTLQQKTQGSSRYGAKRRFEGMCVTQMQMRCD